MLGIILLSILLTVVGIGVYFKFKSFESAKQHDEPDIFDAQALRGMNRMQAGLRRRRAGDRGPVEDSEESDEDDDAGGRGGRRRNNHRARRRGGRWADEEEESEDDEGGGNLQDKAFSRRDAYEAKRAARDAEREAEEAAQEAEIRRAAEERAKKEAEEAEKWMATFSVEAAGEEAISAEEGERQMERMAEYLQRRKTVALEELAAEFSMRTAEAVEKVRQLESEGRITGVMDDRGKFIYVSREEMAAVAEFIRGRGRIAIAELAAKSATLIDLEGKASPLDKGGEGVLVEELELES